MNPSTVVSTRGLKPCQDQPVPRDDFRNFRFSPDHGGRFCGEDDVNLLPRRAQADDLLQKGDELTAGVAGSGFAVDATGGGIEGCISGEGAAAVVLKAVAFGASRRERQVGIKTNQGLNGGLLIDAEHGCGLGWVQIEAEDVGGFGFELGAVIAVSPSRWNIRPPVVVFALRVD
jgi:hypothetical protein